MKVCKMCDDAKFGFQFHSEFMGLYTWVSPICKKCANIIKNEAVKKYCEDNDY